MSKNGHKVRIGKLSEFRPQSVNANKHTERGLRMLDDAMSEDGYVAPMTAVADAEIIDGSARPERAFDKFNDEAIILEHDGTKPIITVRTDIPNANTKEARRIAVRANRIAEVDLEWDPVILAELAETKEIEGMFSDKELAEILTQTGIEPGIEEGAARLTLSERFVIPPFSVLDARQGYWQDRKRAWIALGIQSELGRKHANTEQGNDGLTWSGPAQQFDYYRVKEGTRDETDTSGTSLFDPVLCEIASTWFSPPLGYVLDPFAGGSVRGIVAAFLGRKYTGVDLRPEQVQANEAQAKEIIPDNIPRWITGNSLTDIPKEEYDLVFSCPPYYDLEVYSDDPADLSAYKTYQEFLKDYRAIIQNSIDRLRDDRFACFVVGDIRDKKGMYRNFVSDTITAFQDAGAMLYNEAVLITAVGSLPIRVGRQFSTARKLGKTHQNVLVFVKGDPKKAAEACGPVEVADLAEQFGEVA